MRGRDPARGLPSDLPPAGRRRERLPAPAGARRRGSRNSLISPSARRFHKNGGGERNTANRRTTQGVESIPVSETISADAPTKHARLTTWVEEIAELTRPESIHWCDGSAEEYDRLAQELIDAGTFERLSDELRPNSYLACSDPGDVA